MSEIVVTQSDDGKSIQVRPGDVFLIRLPESPTTGYRWAVAHGDEAILPLQGTDFQESAGAGVGGGGLQTFRFQAQRAGTVELELKLWREWEGDRSITRRYRLTVQVQ
jgi:inhibitor of cysteine peptidase